MSSTRARASASGGRSARPASRTGPKRDGRRGAEHQRRRGERQGVGPDRASGSSSAGEPAGRGQRPVAAERLIRLPTRQLVLGAGRGPAAGRAARSRPTRGRAPPQDAPAEPVGVVEPVGPQDGRPFRRRAGREHEPAAGPVGEQVVEPAVLVGPGMDDDGSLVRGPAARSSRWASTRPAEHELAGERALRAPSGGRRSPGEGSDGASVASSRRAPTSRSGCRRPTSSGPFDSPPEPPEERLLPRRPRRPADGRRRRADRTWPSRATASSKAAAKDPRRVARACARRAGSQARCAASRRPLRFFQAKSRLFRAARRSQPERPKAGPNDAEAPVIGDRIRARNSPSSRPSSRGSPGRGPRSGPGK